MKRFFFFFGLSIVAFSLVLSGCSNDGEFGYKAEGTYCVKQIHGGCVPYEGVDFYDGTLLGLHFVHPTDWVSTESDGVHIKYLPSDRTGDSDPTMLVLWRAYGLDEAYNAVNNILAEEGIGKIGYYDVKFEIYEGTWNETPVKSEWIYLILDEDNPAANFVFFLMTEPENFTVDQEVIKAAASSILME